ncbi:ribose-phosphate pyrophosphokinase [Lysobacter niastensis]|uniref:Ribose-phosphate pyrophosphokinase n=1 Tax=Lysobacter niastensis TaxID=380629 RepID=A0ABS0B776_9GAMM|nr:ribose-phosphate pyrophosphokinase [Lysobacter niastensis]MBF6024879.1 ribose-phosphate pyrophosphokinase [Lysobacter niastensis]
MSRVLLPFPQQRPMAEAMASTLEARLGRLDWRRFPDGESLVAVDESLSGADVAVIATLRNPDEVSIALRFASATAREFGARSVGLVAPYLAYMRQDTRFHPGEAVSAPLYARFLEESFDWLVTLDPHLHRTPELSTLFRIPAARAAAASAVARWIVEHVPNPVLIGPDSESEQWVSDIAGKGGLPWQVLQKQRHGDREVSVSLPDAAALKGCNPVLVDDIVSSGHTLLETLGHLKALGLPPSVCIAIHAVFSGDAYEQLRNAGASQVVSTNSIPHPSNAIEIAGLLTEACADLFGASAPRRDSGRSP